MKTHENDFKRWLRKQWRGFSTTVEYAPGGDEGFPDVLFLVNGVLYPVELKAAQIENGLLVSEEIRPAQIGWHRDLYKGGGHSSFLFGVPIEKRNTWMIYIADSEIVVKHEPGAGFVISEEVDCISPLDGTTLNDILEECFGERI